MSSFIDGIRELPAPFNMVVLIVLISCTAGVVGTIAKEVRKFFCHLNEMQLKREMIERGMEAQEIEHVMRARTAETENYTAG